MSDLLELKHLAEFSVRHGLEVQHRCEITSGHRNAIPGAHIQVQTLDGAVECVFEYVPDLEKLIHLELDFLETGFGVAELSAGLVRYAL